MAKVGLSRILGAYTRHHAVGNSVIIKKEKRKRRKRSYVFGHILYLIAVEVANIMFATFNKKNYINQRTY